MTLTQKVSTDGSNSAGIVAQSLGGGGGNGGMNITGALTASAAGGGTVAVGIGGSGGSGGSAGAVTSTVTGDVAAAGTNSGGVIANRLVAAAVTVA